MKKITFFVMALLCHLLSHAQADSSRADLEYLFSNLNKNLVPNGYLAEWGTDMADREDYKGIRSDSNNTNNMDMFRMLYADIFSARISPSAATMPDLETLNTSIDNASDNPIVMLFARYGEFRPDALQLGRLTYTNGMLYDGGATQARISQSAYFSKELFCAYPKQNMFTNTVTVKYDPSLFYTNTDNTVQSVQADFGEGFQTLSANTVASHTYTDSSGLHIIQFKATLSNGQVMETGMAVHVTLINTGILSRYTLANLNAPDIDVAPVVGLHEGCKVYIRRSIHTPGTQIRKPLIVVEGFDIHDAAPNLGENYDVNKYITELENIIIENTPNRFSYQLDDIGQYDLIFIDWKNGAGDIRANAEALAYVISQINGMKAASGSTEKNVMMGISMGGLISRYCLAKMTKGNVISDVRLMLTMDSPHQGAYVPLAFQHMVRGLQNVRILSFIRLGAIFKGSLDQANDMLNSAGAQQQLKMTVTDANGTVTPNSFLNNIYRPMITFGPNDPPPLYDFKAISNGSQCGVNVMDPGSNLVNGTASANLTALGILLDVLIGLPVITKLKFKTEIDAKALTGVSSHQILRYKLQKEVKLFFVISITKTYANIFRNEPSFNTVPWESVPGGYESLGERLGVGNNPLSGNWSVVAPWFLGYNYNLPLHHGSALCP